MEDNCQTEAHECQDGRLQSRRLLAVFTATKTERKVSSFSTGKNRSELQNTDRDCTTRREAGVVPDGNAAAPLRAQATTGQGNIKVQHCSKRRSKIRKGKAKLGHNIVFRHRVSIPEEYKAPGESVKNPRLAEAPTRGNQ